MGVCLFYFTINFESHSKSNSKVSVLPKNNNKLMELKNLLEDDVSQDLKETRVSDSTTCTDNDCIPEEGPLDIFSDVDFKKCKMAHILNSKVEQPSITAQMTKKLVDWLFSNFWRFDMENQAILLCLNIMRIYLKNKTMQKNQLQGLGLACMYIASKYVQVKKLNMVDILLLTNGTCSSRQIIEIQADVLDLLNFELELPGFYKYYEIIQSQNRLGDDEINKLLFWIEVCLLKGLLQDYDQKKIIQELLDFVLNPKRRSQTVSDLIQFVTKTQYRYVVKKFLSHFDIDSYLLEIQFQ